MPIQAEVVLLEYTLECANRVTALIVGTVEWEGWFVRMVEQTMGLRVPGEEATGETGFYRAKFWLAERGEYSERVELREGAEEEVVRALRSFFGEDWTITVL